MTSKAPPPFCDHLRRGVVRFQHKVGDGVVTASLAEGVHPQGVFGVPWLLVGIRERFMVVGFDRPETDWRMLDQSLEEVDRGIFAHLFHVLGEDERVEVVESEIEVRPTHLVRQGMDFHGEMSGVPISHLRGLFALAVGNATDAIAFEASVERRTAESRDHRFQANQAIVKRKARAFAEDDDQRLLDYVEHGRGRLFRPHARVRRRAPAPPFGDCFWIEPEPDGEGPVGLPALLDLASELRGRAGAWVTLSGHDLPFVRPMREAATKS
jgi:hypothetical protein